MNHVKETMDKVRKQPFPEPTTACLQCNTMLTERQIRLKLTFCKIRCFNKYFDERGFTYDKEVNDNEGRFNSLQQM